MLYEVYSRKNPYEGEIAAEVLKAVADKNIRKRPLAPASMPEKVKSVYTDCIEDDKNLRPSFEELDTRLKRIGIEIAEEIPSKPKVSLFDIFPRHVAEALRDGRKPEAEHKDCVTIFFSGKPFQKNISKDEHLDRLLTNLFDLLTDIVGFTDISAALEPSKVANLLIRLYLKFDELSSKHDCYKVRLPHNSSCLTEHTAVISPIFVDLNRSRRLETRTWLLRILSSINPTTMSNVLQNLPSMRSRQRVRCLLMSMIQRKAL